MFKSDASYRKFSYEISHRRRYIFDEEALEFVNEFKNKIGDYKATIEKGTILCRAQIGYNWRDLDYEGTVIDKIPCAFPPERMIPLADKSKEGRVNPKGLPYLYLSNDEKTAIAETRPWIGSYVSIGYFEVMKNLSLIHFTDEKKNHVFYINGPPKEKYDEIVWNDINRAFSQPVINEDDTAEYVPTQYLAEVIKAERYDGVIYKSKVGDGLNIALFDICSAKLTSCYLTEVKKVEIEYEQIDNPYSIKKAMNECKFEET